MGQDVESYFQEVMATVEQSVEEGSRGEGGALRGRLQQLYSEIVGEIDAGKRRRGSKSWKHWAQYECTLHMIVLAESEFSFRRPCTVSCCTFFFSHCTGS